MKFLLSLAAVVAVAVAGPTQRSFVSPIGAGPAPIVDENGQPISIGPAIIAGFEPISVGPAIVDTYEPISIGPAIVDYPIAPAPVVVGPTQPGQSAPLVQIILNINQASLAAPSPVDVTPVVVDQTPVVPEPVQIVDTPTIVEPVQVVDVAPVVPEPVIIGTPIIPAPAVVLPEILN